MSEISYRLSQPFGKYGLGTVFSNLSIVQDRDPSGQARTPYTSIQIKKILNAQPINNQQLVMHIGCYVQLFDPKQSIADPIDAAPSLEDSLISIANLSAIAAPAYVKEEFDIDDDSYQGILGQLIRWTAVPSSKFQFRVLAHVDGTSPDRINLAIGDGDVTLESAETVDSFKCVPVTTDPEQIRNIILSQNYVTYEVDEEKLENADQTALKKLANELINSSVMSEYAAALTKDNQAGQTKTGEWIAEEWLPDIAEFDGGGFWFVPDKH